MTAPYMILISRKLYCDQQHKVMMKYKYSSYRKGNATDTETTKIAKETDSFHLVLSGVRVTTNIAKGLENYFSLLHPNSCTKLEVEPNILTPFQSHVVGSLVFLPLQNPHHSLTTSPGRLIGISISSIASKKQGAKTGEFNTSKKNPKQQKNTPKKPQPLAPPLKTPNQKNKQENLIKTCTKPAKSKC